MQAVQASPEGAHLANASPPRQKGSSLASIAISSFAAFRSQSSYAVPVAVQSPVRRKPLPVDSPVVGRSAVDQQAKASSAAAPDKGPELSAQRGRAPDNTLSLPLSDEDLFLPRNLDE
jgi:hypothetical protein